MIFSIRSTKLCLGASALALLVAGPALAQKGPDDAGGSSDLPPASYGEVTLETGYAEDPWGVELQAGGNVDASTLGDGCWGNIAEAPDVTLNYTAGDVFPLNIYVDSSADTTLAVMTPDGSVTCNDDFNGLQAGIIFDNPESGSYDIWVGTYSSSAGFPEAMLYISEVYTDPAQSDPVMIGTDGATSSGAGSSGGGSSSGGSGGGSGGDMPATAFEFFEMGSAMSGDVMSYDSASPIGDDGFSVSGLVLDTPEGTFTIDTLTVNRIDWQASLNEQPPAFVDMSVDGMVIDLNDIPDGQEAIDVLGTDMVTMNMALDYALDGDTLDLGNLLLELVDLGTFTLAANASGLDQDMLANSPEMAMFGMMLNSATATYTDAGLVGTALEAGQQETGMAPDEIVQMAVQQIEGLRGMVTSNAGNAGLDAIIAFLQDHATPGGTLTVDLAPPNPVNPMMLMSITNPDAAVEMLGATVTYQ
ncbi:MAG: hypothetical protein RLO50_09330 [Azospirillaceae bacterium]